MRIRTVALVLLPLALAAPWMAHAQPDARPNGRVQMVPVPIPPGFTALLRVERTIRTIAIGNPDIADASVQTDKSVLITAKRIGETNLIVLDEDGREMYNALVRVGGGASGGVHVHAGSSSRSSTGRFAIHDFAAYQCSSDNCRRLDPREERVPVEVGPSLTFQQNAEAPAASTPAAPSVEPAPSE